MKIETKFNIGDEVFYHAWEKLEKGIIRNIQIENNNPDVLYCVNGLQVPENNIISDKNDIETLKKIFSEKNS